MDNAISRLLKVLAWKKSKATATRPSSAGWTSSPADGNGGRLRQTQPEVDEIVALLIGYPAIEDTATRRIIDR